MKNNLFLHGMALILFATIASSAPPADAPVAFKSLKEIVEVLPHPLIQQFKIGAKVEGSKQEANKVFTDKVVGKMVTIKVHAQDWQPVSGPENNEDKMRITMVPVPVNVLGTTFKVNFWIVIPPDQIPVLSKITKGGEITATGQLTRCELSSTPEGLKLNGDLRHAKLEAR